MKRILLTLTCFASLLCGGLVAGVGLSALSAAPTCGAPDSVLLGWEDPVTSWQEADPINTDVKYCMLDNQSGNPDYGEDCIFTVIYGNFGEAFLKIEYDSGSCNGKSSSASEETVYSDDWNPLDTTPGGPPSSFGTWLQVTDTGGGNTLCEADYFICLKNNNACGLLQDFPPL